jgi:hypothetical protein
VGKVERYVLSGKDLRESSSDTLEFVRVRQGHNTDDRVQTTDNPQEPQILSDQVCALMSPRSEDSGPGILECPEGLLDGALARSE